MRVCHTADLHIGVNRGYPNYLDRQRQAINEILSIVDTEKCNVLAIAGDIFDNHFPTHEERKLVADLFNDSPVPIIAIPGQHDKWGTEWGDTSLNWLIKLAKRIGHLIVDEPRTVKFEHLWWGCLPYGGYDQANLNVLATWLVEQVPSNHTLPLLFMSHEFYSGASTDVGYSKKKAVKLPLFDEVSNYLLGDVHKMQRVCSNGWYSGNPFQKDFGEKLPKGVLIVDPGHTPRFVEVTSPTPLVSFTKVPASWPTDVFIKLSIRGDQLPENLPSNVVQIDLQKVPVDSKKLKQVHKLANRRYLLSGLDEFLLGKGLSPKRVKRGMILANKFLEEIQS